MQIYRFFKSVVLVTKPLFWIIFNKQWSHANWNISDFSTQQVRMNQIDLPEDI